MLNCQPHDISALVSSRLLKPLGNPAQNGSKFSARRMADLGADSLDVVEISMTLEELFEVTIPDEQWDKLETVGELYDELGRILQQRTNAS